MSASELDKNVQYLRGVGPAAAAKFAKLKIHTVGELLGHYPRTYEDRSVIMRIGDLEPGIATCVRGSVLNNPAAHYLKGGKSYAKFSVCDDSGAMDVTVFNPRYLKVEKGKIYTFFGEPRVYGRFMSMINPAIEPEGETRRTGRIVPVYDLTAGLSNGAVMRAVENALGYAGLIREILNKDIKTRLGLMSAEQAVRQIHKPESRELLDAARRRLAFEELYLMSLGLSRIKSGRRESGETIKCGMEPFFSALPFALTLAQSRAACEALEDMAKENAPAMRRIIEGDVGSGKTVVAAACAYAAVQCGFQCAMMVPTEILAMQHAHDLSELMTPLGVSVGVLTSGMPAADRRETLKGISDGTVGFIIGTHALISEGVEYARLRLVITDEQHRFGVRQRAKLKDKADRVPHMLVMSATPIPRTLAMVLYGDMDLSVIDELPPGRIPVDTRAPEEEKRRAVYGFMERQFQKGRQAYVVCPAIEKNEETDITSVEEHARILYGVFKNRRIAVMHGQMPQKEKDAVMAKFVNGGIDLLVSTTVVEVGVNVPNATMMVIENAERFGLSQLHQLRGRVGRSHYKSYCVLFSRSRSETVRERLDIMCRTTDGFEIAREDLRLRGPGEFFGERQSGVPGLKVAQLGADMDMLETAHKEAQALLAADPDLSRPEHLYVREKLKDMFSIE